MGFTHRRFDIAIVPVAKPRQTRRDVWAKRPCVLAYRDYADALREEWKRKGLGEFPSFAEKICFRLPMPASWSKKKRAAMNGKPHQAKPDLDNLVKALFDALAVDDKGIWGINARKVWSDRPGVDMEWYEK